MERLYAEVRGRVQGVGFRWFVQREARSLGLTGWTRNLADGRRVEVVAEGHRADLERLVDALKRGPSGSRVEAVDANWAPATGEFGGFEIRAG
ncbi:MAG TPA: acylphosphatase [Chloroflexota bacterium]|nr:acylphosphatase [Chloroflexota bacterium]